MRERKVPARPCCCACRLNLHAALAWGHAHQAAGGPRCIRLAIAFRQSIQAVWNRNLSFQEHAAARSAWASARDDILRAPIFGGVDRFIFKHSWPFGFPRAGHSLHLRDIEDLFPGSRHVVICRDPPAATYSALRRGFDTNLRRLAVVCAEQLTRLAAQVAALPQERMMVVSYEIMCAEPASVLGPLLDFCEISPEETNVTAERAGLNSRANSRYGEELGEEAAWLGSFFDSHRRRQWSVLEA